jgi:hypothetical protein
VGGHAGAIVTARSGTPTTIEHGPLSAEDAEAATRFTFVGPGGTFHVSSDWGSPFGAAITYGRWGVTGSDDSWTSHPNRTEALAVGRARAAGRLSAEDWLRMALDLSYSHLVRP